ncbi:MAG: hypothetical protein JWN76_3146 [Chitinophagaceae bacterium]|nr:hypothetical protein [Chitinophagaceae bacterium]
MKKLLLLAAVLLSLSFTVAPKTVLKKSCSVDLALTAASNYKFEIYKSAKAAITVELIKLNADNSYTVTWKKDIGEYILFDCPEQDKAAKLQLDLSGQDLKNTLLLYRVTYSYTGGQNNFKKEFTADPKETSVINITI